MNVHRLIFKVGMARSKGTVKKRYSKEFQRSFYAASRKYFKAIAGKTPDIGKSLFAFNYAFGPAYIAWYKAACDLGLSKEDIEKILWLMNEKIITVIPGFARSAYGKQYLDAFRKKAPLHEKCMEAGAVHPYDYLIKFLPEDNTHFGINIERCGMRTLAADFDALGIFPAVCRVDYMIGAYLHSGFERTKTLGDGDECCNCRYTIGGVCEWAPEKGFGKRK